MAGLGWEVVPTRASSQLQSATATATATATSTATEHCYNRNHRYLTAIRKRTLFVVFHYPHCHGGRRKNLHRMWQ